MGDGEDIVAQLAVGGATGRILFVVDEPDALFERAVAAGATATSPPADEHGWRLARLIDPFGHEWELGHPLGTWPSPWRYLRRQLHLHLCK